MDIEFKIPKIPRKICQIGCLAICILKIVAIAILAWYTVSTEVSSNEQLNNAMIIGIIATIFFVVLEALREIFIEAAKGQDRIPLAIFELFIGARNIITICIMFSIFIILPNLIVFKGTPIEVIQQEEGDKVTNTHIQYEYVDEESNRPMFPINFSTDGVVVLSCSEKDKSLVEDFIKDNKTLVDTRTIMLNNGTLGFMAENENYSEVKFYNTDTSLSALLEKQDIHGEILYVGSPNLASYEGSPNMHDARLILYSPVEVTEEERTLLNASFESVEIISVITIK